MLTDGKQIAAARQLLGWSQTDLAERAGVSKPSVVRAEKDLMSVKEDIRQAVKIAFHENEIEFLPLKGLRHNKQTIKILKGQTGFQKFYDDLYTTARDIGGQIALFNGVSDLVTKWLGNDYIEIQKKRMLALDPSSFNFRVIVEEGDAVFFGAKYCVYKWFPANLFNNKTIYIYGDKVAFINFSADDVEVMILNQQELAECQMLFFNLAWEYIAMEIKEEIRDHD